MNEQRTFEDIIVQMEGTFDDINKISTAMDEANKSLERLVKRMRRASALLDQFGPLEEHMIHVVPHVDHEC